MVYTNCLAAYQLKKYGLSSLVYTNLKAIKLDSINSSINIIGSIPDFSLIEAALELFAKGKGKLDLKELIVTNNAFDFRTEGSRIRFKNGVLGSIIVFANDTHKSLIENLFLTPGHGSIDRKSVV